VAQVPVLLRFVLIFRARSFMQPFPAAGV
jgi:hypothetical protein